MKICLVLFFIFFIEGIYAIKLSPTEIYFEGSTHEKICRNVSVFSDDAVIIEDRWGINSEKYFLDYKLNPAFFDINVSYPKEFFSEDSFVVPVCIVGEKKGIYSGILLVKEKNFNEGAGVWMEVNLSSNDKPFLRITGFLVGKTGKGAEEFFLILSFVLLLVLFLMLLLFKKTKKVK